METALIIGGIFLVLCALDNKSSGTKQKSQPRQQTRQPEPRREPPPKKPQPTSYSCMACGRSTNSTAPPSYGCECGAYAWTAR